MSSEFVRYEVDTGTGVATITLAYPERLNALTRGITSGINSSLDSAQTASDVRAIIITGEGRGFCAGLDMRRGPTTIGVGSANPAPAGAMAVRLQQCEKPTIAAINGIAVGAGLRSESTRLNSSH